jgi:protein-tyrosine phosphatase
MNVWWITPQLGIRGKFDDRPMKLKELWDLGVTSVVCMLRKTDQDCVDCDWLEYRQFPLPDTDTVKEEALWGAANHAADEIRAGKKVIIHCIAARDRAPTTAAATLHLLEGISGSEAMYRVKSVKNTTFHNQAFVAYLNNLPARWHNESIDQYERFGPVFP